MARLFNGSAKLWYSAFSSGACHATFRPLEDPAGKSSVDRASENSIGPDLGSSIEVVAIMKATMCEREVAWDAFLSELRVAAASKVPEDRYDRWLADVHCASSSAQVARNFAHHDPDDEPVFLFYLHDANGAQQACMQVRVCGSEARIDALCSLGNRSGASFMRHLSEWLPTAAPRVTHIAVTPLSNGWLRHEYYKGFGFVAKSSLLQRVAAERQRAASRSGHDRERTRLEELAFRPSQHEKRPRNLFEANPGTHFQVGHSNNHTQKANTLATR